MYQKMTPSRAKNSIGKALREIFDPSIRKSDERIIRQFFDNKCAYCGRDIPPTGRTGHMDHVVSRKKGGTNHLSNIILSCNSCNGDEKRETDWIEFLDVKVSDPETRCHRRRRIEEWIKSQGGPVAMPDDLDKETEAAHRTVSEVFDREVARLKKMLTEKASG